MKKTLLGILTTIGLVCCVFALLDFGIGKFGQSSSVAQGSASRSITLLEGLLKSTQQPIPQLLMQLVIIVSIARMFGSLFERLGQPPVVGEMLAGIVLGPTVVGALFPSFSSFVFPLKGMGNLQMLSQVGIMLFMFVVGMELDAKHVRHKAHAAVVISQVSIAFPFLLGVALSLLIYKSFAPANSNFLAFSLFLGISMSITAFPVLARIIKEKGLSGSDLGATAISCAAVGDVSAWCILAVIVALARASDVTGSIATMALSCVFVAVMFLVVKPVLERLANRIQIVGEPSKALTATCVMTLFASAFATEVIGIHGLFGAFVAGIVMPKSVLIREFLQERLEYFSTLILVPIFFAFTGLRTQMGAVVDTGTIGVLVAIVGVAVAGKFGGTLLAARYSGMSWRESTAIGALMNTRGLIELIALNIGLDLGILSPKVFSMLVLMAIVTTFMAGPILSLLGYGKKAEQNAPSALAEGA